MFRLTELVIGRATVLVCAEFLNRLFLQKYLEIFIILNNIIHLLLF